MRLLLFIKHKLTDANCDHFPVPLEVDARIISDATDQCAGHVDHVGGHAPDLGHIELGGQVEGIRVGHRVAKQIRIKLFQDVGQSA